MKAQRQNRGKLVGMGFLLVSLLLWLIFSVSAAETGSTSSSSTNSTTNNTSNSSTSNGPNVPIRSAEVVDGYLVRTYENGLIERIPIESGSNNNNNNNNTASGTTGSASYSNPGTPANGTNNSASIQNGIIVETEPTVTGPTVETVELSENYNESYGLYEEALENDFYFYSTVGNGAITNNPVDIDMPKNLSCTMEKDGVEVDFPYDEPITDYGSYVLRVAAVKDPELTFSEQHIVKAVFRFKITSRPERETEPETEEREEPETYSEGPSSSIRPDSQIRINSDDAGSSSGRTFSQSEFDALFGGGAEEEETESEPETEPETEAETEPETEAETQIEETEPEVPEIPKENEIPPYERGAGFSSSYDMVRGFYRNELLTGDSFYTSCPNGMVTSEPVMIQSSADVSFALYKDGVYQEDYAAGNYVEDAGSYTLYVSQDTPDYRASYGMNRSLPFHFRILSRMVGDLSFLPAPQGMRFQEVRYNGDPASPAIFLNESEIRFLYDGLYEISMADEAGVTRESVWIDRLPPVFSVSVEPNRAEVRYASQDVSNVNSTGLSRNDEQLDTEGSIINEVLRAGRYSLDVYDLAGNVASTEFQVRYRVNTAAVLAILLVIALLAGLVVFFLRVNKKINVR